MCLVGCLAPSKRRAEGQKGSWLAMDLAVLGAMLVVNQIVRPRLLVRNAERKVVALPALLAATTDPW